MSDGTSRRLFVAIFPPEPALEHLGVLVDGLAVARGGGAAARLTLREGWHLTLAFLGPVPSERLADAESAMARATRQWLATRAAAGLTLCLTGGGTFGTGDRQILWAGVGGDLLGLHELAEAVRAGLAAAGLRTDPRGFQPHLTISRPGVAIRAALLTTDASRLDDYHGPMWTVDAVDLVASDTDTYTDTIAAPAGPRSRYTRLATIAV